MIRILDIAFSTIGLLILSPLIVIIYLLLLKESRQPFFFQKRVGQYRSPFTLVKFRTMRIDTKSIASHLNSEKNITKIGLFLRKYKIDEIPQLWNVLKGEMSLVGARPCLESQQALISFRSQYKVFNYRPGITGLGQINNIDMSTPKKLALYDKKMLESMNICNYLFFIIKTIQGTGTGDAIISKTH